MSSRRNIKKEIKYINNEEDYLELNGVNVPIFQVSNKTGENIDLLKNYLLSLNSSTVKIIATCTFFAAVSYRAIPSLHKILFYYYNVKYHQPIFAEIIQELDIENKILYHNDKFNINNTINLIQLL